MRGIQRGDGREHIEHPAGGRPRPPRPAGAWRARSGGRTSPPRPRPPRRRPSRPRRPRRRSHRKRGSWRRAASRRRGARPASSTGSRVPAAAKSAFAPDGLWTGRIWERVAMACAGRAGASGAGMASSMGISRSELGGTAGWAAWVASPAPAGRTCPGPAARPLRGGSRGRGEVRRRRGSRLSPCGRGSLRPGGRSRRGRGCGRCS